MRERCSGLLADCPESYGRLVCGTGGECTDDGDGAGDIGSRPDEVRDSDSDGESGGGGAGECNAGDGYALWGTGAGVYGDGSECGESGCDVDSDGRWHDYGDGPLYRARDGGHGSYGHGDGDFCGGRDEDG